MSIQLAFCGLQIGIWLLLIFGTKYIYKKVGRENGLAASALFIFMVVVTLAVLSGEYWWQILLIPALFYGQ